MYGIFTSIYHKYQPNVGVYTIHGSYRILKVHIFFEPPFWLKAVPALAVLSSPPRDSDLQIGWCGSGIFEVWLWLKRLKVLRKSKKHIQTKTHLNGVNLHPGRLTWNLLINHLERKMIFRTSMIVFHVNLPGCRLWCTISRSTERFFPKPILQVCFKTSESSKIVGVFFRNIQII